ncbi:hypothetical protein HAP54_000010875 [Bradyrhizobium sp. 2S1]|nr:hypothetical protein [Bradyrhizobium sp. 2S1]MCK7665603.1 hypothetical protein [Bradyrhizobium sp. 2S1]
MPAITMTTSDTPAKKIPLLSFIGFLQYGFVAAMDASRARIATQFHEPAISVAASAMKMTATLLRRYRRKVVAITATIFGTLRAPSACRESLAPQRNLIAPEHVAASLQIAH